MLTANPSEYQSKFFYSLPEVSNGEMSSLKIKGADKQAGNQDS